MRLTLIAGNHRRKQSASRVAITGRLSDVKLWVSEQFSDTLAYKKSSTVVRLS